MMGKKIIYSIILALGIGLTQSSCSKYEDGPAISFRSTTSRLTNHWKFSKVTSNSVDITNQFGGYEWEIREDGIINESVNSVQTKTGTWHIDKDLLDGMLVFNYSNGDVDLFTIKRLTKNEMTVFLFDVGPFIELTTK
jgi:hypothetical protein